jgi:hypothetical protein
MTVMNERITAIRAANTHVMIDMTIKANTYGNNRK